MAAITFRSPAPHLQPFVSTYWHLEADLPDRTIQSYIPGITVAWIFNLDDAGLIRHANGSPDASDDLPACFVKGPTTVASHVEPAATTRNYGIAFKAGAASLFTAVPLGELRDRMLDLFALDDRDLALLARLVQSSGFDDVTRLFDRFLSSRLSDATDIHLGRMLYHGLCRSAGSGQSRFVLSSGYSERHLRRLFQDKLGTSPKTAARIGRLRYTLDAMQRGVQPLSQIASSAGYFDQAHLNREFKAMIGASPIVFQSNLAPLARRFNEFEASPKPDRASR